MTYVGDLPVVAICKVIILVLIDRRVFITDQAKDHVKTDHPEVYSEYLAMLPELVTHPTYIGLYDKKEFALQLATPLSLRGESILVGVDLHTVVIPQMKNTVSSFYRLDGPSFRNRTRSDILRPVPYP